VGILNFEFRVTRREVTLYRGVELSEAALRSYRVSVGRLISWSMFSSFTEKREVAEEYGRAWRGGIRVMFELRAASCPRLGEGIYLLHPFTVLQVNAVVGNAVKLVEVELLESARVMKLPGRRPGVFPMDGKVTQMHNAVAVGDVRTISRLGTRPELVTALNEWGWTALVHAAFYGKTEAVKALAWLGANVDGPDKDGATPLYVAAQNGHLEVVKTLASLGAEVNAPTRVGVTPVYVAALNGHLEVVKLLASLGGDVDMPAKDRTTPLSMASYEGHVEVVKALVSLGADVNFVGR
jgi:hypothetical protein